MRKYYLLIVFLVFYCTIQTSFAKNIYVSGSGLDSNNGASWDRAYKTISKAINSASSGDNIFVAKGIYDVASGVILKNGVNMYGGFIGTEDGIADRQYVDVDTNGVVERWELKNATVLNGDGTGSILNQTTTFTNPTNIDGFTLMGGRATNGGGANLQIGVTLSGCIVQDNVAENGGGLYLDGAIARDNLIRDNLYIKQGGGVYVVNGGEVERCKVSGNIFIKESALKVGNIYGGGIIFYIDRKSGKGLIVSLVESLGEWGNNALVGASSLNNGALNTIDMLSNGSSIAQWSNEYSTEGFSDWFLPASEQLQKLYIVKEVINKALMESGGTSLIGDTYWSSSEVDINAAYAIYFDTGYAGSMRKENRLKVRAIREFSF